MPSLPVPPPWPASSSSSAGAPPAALSVPAGRADSIADLGTLSWVNALLGWIWPKTNMALKQFVHGDLTPRLREALPSPFKSAHFSRFTLGENTPEFGPIEVIRHSDTHVEVDLEMRYFSDVDALLDAGTGGITLGIKHLNIAGRLCVVLSPVLEKLPVIGAVRVFFAAPPKVGLKFTGLAAVAHYPGIEQLIQRTVDDWMRSRLVLPASKVLCCLREEDGADVMEAFRHMPLGAVRVRVLRGFNLAGVNWRALETARFTSDPYCVLRLGPQSVRTGTVSGSTSPEWPADEPSAHFVVYHRDQQLEVEVLGEDRGALFARNFTGFLGRISLSVCTIMKEWPEHAAADARLRRSRVALDTAQVSRDMLHVNDPVNRGIPSELELEVEWLDLVEPMETPEAAAERQVSPPTSLGSGGGGAPAALLLLEIYKGVGFPAEAAGEGLGLRWRTQVEDEAPLLSRRGDPCDMEHVEFPELPIDPMLFPVIDKLADRRFSLEDITHIIGVESPELVTLYLQSRREHDQKLQALETRQQHKDHRVSLQWVEGMLHFVRRPESASVTLDLLDGEDRVLGRVGPLPLAPLLEDSGVLGRTTHVLSAAAAGAGGGPAGLVSWFMQSRAQAPDTRRFATVEVELSARLWLLQAGGGSRRSSGRGRSPQPGGGGGG